jgi:hemerythrin-like domain-containing protein
MQCTELISRDHVILRRGLDILDGMVKKLEEGERIEIADVTAILKFLKFFGDEYHQAMEERILFPALLPTDHRRVHCARFSRSTLRNVRSLPRLKPH